ncbi:hypothetical protein [Microlunatus endophyticus]|uniref:hypothetical protein n=1 Tax=Microlunatus endophyticus TaxID=1716077 RepID=UPI00166E390D|nr:hypothetical protein [Microlunatus endophyticus]
MNGELAALVALCLYGNNWLAAQADDPPALDADTEIFTFVKRWRAIELTERDGESVPVWQGDGIAAWFAHLAGSGVRRLTLVTADDERTGPLDSRIAAAFANGGSWTIAADGPRPRLWMSRWTVGDRDDPQQRIWNVDHLGHALPRPLVASPDLAAAHAALHERLRAALEFAQAQGLDSWAGLFRDALGLLEDTDPSFDHFPWLASAKALGRRPQAHGCRIPGLGVRRHGLVERPWFPGRGRGTGLRTAQLDSLRCGPDRDHHCHQQRRAMSWINRAPRWPPQAAGPPRR